MAYRMAMAAAFIVFPVSAGAATIENGSLTGPLALAGVPSGWSILTETPDTNDVNNPVGGAANSAYTVQPQNSPDGGTWVGIGGFGSDIGIGGESFEAFGQAVDDFVVGHEYRLDWTAANPGFDLISNGVLIDQRSGPNSIGVLLDGSIIGSGSELALGSEWFAQSLTFTATSTTHLLGFRPLSTDESYLQIDGISLSKVTSTVPLPPAALMLLSALGLLASRKLTLQTGRRQL